MKKIVLGISCLLAASVAVADTIEMKVYGLVCAFCAQGIEKTLRKHPAVADVIVSLDQKLVAVATKEGADVADADLARAVIDAGYDVKSVTRTQRTMAEIRAVLRSP